MTSPDRPRQPGDVPDHDGVYAAPTIAEFLRARLDERAAVAEHWPDALDPPPPGRLFWIDTHGHPIYEPRAFVLADVEAKRRIVELHQPRGVQGGPPYRWACAVCDHSPVPWDSTTIWPCRTVRLLALPYAGHAQYRDEWRPDAP